jgi:AraC family transcriptional regulator, transcriptional activator of pobA
LLCLPYLRSALRQIPSFSLYGEHAAGGHTDALHIEDIQSRSRKYLWKIATHRHSALCQLVMVASGPVHVLLEETSADFSGPAVILIPAGTVHSFKFRADTHGYVLTVDLDRLLGEAAGVHQGQIQSLFAAPRAVPLQRDLGLAQRVFKQLEILETEFRQPDSLSTPVCAWLASSVLAVLAHGVSVQTAPELWSTGELKQLRHFKELVEANHTKHWPVKRYAALLKISETSLNRLCRRLCATTAFDLIQQRLALEARRRLMYVALSVHGIASELGFKDAAYFSRFFRRHSGVSPHEFRRHQGGG